MAKKDAEGVEPEQNDADHAELRVYELGFHIDPELTADEAKKAYQGVRAVAEAAGPIIAEGEPTKIPLAYTVSRGEVAGRRDFDSSFFAWIAYEANGEGHEKVVAAAKADSRIFRFLDIRTDKDAAKHAAEMFELMTKVEPAEGAEGEVSEAELDAALKEVA